MSKISASEQHLAESHIVRLISELSKINQVYQYVDKLFDYTHSPIIEPSKNVMQIFRYVMLDYLCVSIIRLLERKEDSDNHQVFCLIKIREDLKIEGQKSSEEFLKALTSIKKYRNSYLGHLNIENGFRYNFENYDSIHSSISILLNEILTFLNYLKEKYTNSTYSLTMPSLNLSSFIEQMSAGAFFMELVKDPEYKHLKEKHLNWSNSA